MVALYGNKIGMSQVFDEDGVLIPVTFLSVDISTVVSKKNKKNDGYDASVLATGETKLKHVTKAHVGQFKSSGLSSKFPKGRIKKKLFETKYFADKQNGDEFGIELFEKVIFVDVTGITKGKGFQGVMKRHGMHGGPARHGSKFHRSIGSVGQGGTPARFRKGSRMPGRMGATKSTAQNLRVINVNVEDKILTVMGAVPGPNGSQVFIKTAVKKTNIKL